MRKFLVVVALLAVLAVQPLASAQGATRSAVYRLEKTYRLSNDSSGAARDVVSTILILDNRSVYASQQVLSEEMMVDGATVAPEIPRIEDNRVAKFSLGTMGPGADKTITITQIVRVDAIAPIDPSAVHGEVPSDLSTYTQPVAYLWESDNPALQSEALELIENKPDYYLKVKAIFDFVENHLTYAVQSTEHSALWAYNSHVGDCTEFTNLFSALCRAAGIPTRFVSGYGYQPQQSGTIGHAFAFVYMPGVGWVPMDLTWNHPRGEFATLPNDHIIELTSDGSNLVSDSQIKVQDISTSWSYVVGQPASISYGKTEQLTCEVGVELQPSAEAIEVGQVKSFSVTVKNIGTQTITNVKVELVADNKYFEVLESKSISSLAAGASQAVAIGVKAKENVEGSELTARATCDSSPYGTFYEEEQTFGTAYVLPSVWEEPTNDLMIAMVAILIVVIAIGVAARLRR